MEKKVNYVNQLTSLCEEYNKILLVNADNVSSLQFQEVRIALRGKAVILMGKKTLMKKGFVKITEKNPKLKALIPYLKGNTGLVFTSDDVNSIRDVIVENKKGANAKQGAISPCKVVIPHQNTGMEPTKTSFFQALNIPTKITKGSVEITQDVVILEEGQKVGSSEATLLKLLNIRPFEYGLRVFKVYDDGEIYDAEVLDLTDDNMRSFFMAGVNNVASVSLQTGIPTEASIPHSIANSFKNLLSVAATTAITFKEAEEVKEFLKDPTKFAVAAAPSESKKEEAVVEESEEESEEDMLGALF